MTYKLTSDDVDLIQFNGRYQLQSQSPCCCCKLGLLNPEALRVTGLIGKGSFGEVYLVDFGLNKASFALKAVEKAKMSGVHRSHIVNERRIMSCVSHPFLVQCAGHWQTRTHLYLVMEYVEGQDLYSLLSKNIYFGKNVATFYLSEVLVSLEYLHNLGIVYRDLKLENILVDLSGHIKIVDFGFSKKMVRSNTICGTSEYLAPELFRGERYDKGEISIEFQMIQHRNFFHFQVSIGGPSEC